MSGIDVIDGQQALLSEKLLLLKEFEYAHNEPKSLPFYKTVRTELELLDSVASILTTGRGDTFATALDKSKGFVEIVLAKNGKPTMEDKEFVTDFFALLIDPNVKNATDVFPFLLKHVETISTRGSGNSMPFPPILNSTVQFPQGHSNLDKDKEYDTLLKECLIQTKTLSKESLNESISEAHDTIFALSTSSGTLAKSAFMQQLKGRGGKSNVGKKAGKFIRHAEKLGRYVRGVRRLLKYAKRLLASGPVIPHRWIEDTFSKTGEGEVQFRAKNAYEVVCRIRGINPLPAKHSENLDKLYPSNREPWKPLFAYLHPEIRVILSLLQPDEQQGTITRAIGLSKQPCLSCMFWIKHYNWVMSTNWVMNSFWGKPDPTFALPGEAYPGNSHAANDFSHQEIHLDRYVEGEVYMALESELQWFLKRGYHYK